MANRGILVTSIISSIGVLFAIIFSVISLYHSCDNKKSIEKINSVNYRPRIEVINYPKVRMTSDTLKSELITLRESGTLDIPIYIKVSFEAEIINSGNSTAILQLLLWADTTSVNSLLREKVLEKQLSNIEVFDPFFQNDLLPEMADTVKVFIEKNIQFTLNETFTLHMLFIYENELDNIYDTYYWAQFSCKPIIIPISKYLVTKEQKVIGFMGVTTVAEKDIFEFIQSKSSFHNYFDREEKAIKNILQKYIKL